MKLKKLLMCVCLFGVIINAGAKSYEIDKTITKTFKVSDGYTLSVENKYGNINVKTWDKQEIYFEIKITVGTNDKDVLQERLNSIDVKFEQSGRTVSAQTVFNKTFENCNNCSMEINYQITAPKNINCKIENKYGNVNLPSITGASDINVKYGNLNTENLSGSNKINVEYGNLNSGNLSGNHNLINVKYGNIHIDNLIGDDNTLTAAYAGTISIEKINKAKIDVKYSNLHIGTADELTIESGYTKVYIDKLNKSISTNIKYAAFDIKYVSPALESVTVNASYTNVNIKFDPNASFNLDAYTQYGNINFRSSNIASIESTSASVESTSGSGGSSSASGGSMSWSGGSSSASSSSSLQQPQQPQQPARASSSSSSSARASSSHRSGNISSVSESNKRYVSGVVGSSPKATVKITNKYANINLNT
ncbi:MAG: hypothetical protein LBR10_06260 [Prevotellaceae bacterium]|jgi:hypothetical protein|nr:hypothetical protein [Prevotellaceae bacterium]